MDRETALKLSKEFKVHYLQLLREEWEMVILKRLFESALGKNLVFKGGTALRLAYNSPRFSEDLDFSILIIKDFNKEEFIQFLKELEKKYPAIIGVEVNEKFYTIFG